MGVSSRSGHAWRPVLLLQAAETRAQKNAPTADPDRAAPGMAWQRVVAWASKVVLPAGWSGGPRLPGSQALGRGRGEGGWRATQ